MTISKTWMGWLAMTGLGAGLAFSQADNPPPVPSTVPAVEQPAAPAEPAAVVAPAETVEPATPVEITPVESVEVKPAAETPGEVVRVPIAPKDETQKIKDDLVTLSLNDVPLSEVVSLFMRLSGANIVASPTQLTGRVSVNLKEVEWRTALNEILSMHGLTLYESQPGTKLYTITPPRAAAEIPTYTQTFQLRYAQAESISNGVMRLVSPNGAVLQASGKNLAILGTTKQIENVKKLIEELDKMIAQVAVEAKFVELNDQAIKDLGINWQALEAYTITAKAPTFDYKRTDTAKGLVQDASLVSDGESSTLVKTSGSDPGTTLKTDNSGRAISLLSGANWSDYDAKENKLTTVPKRDVATTRISSSVLSAADFALTLSALKQNTGIEIITNPKVVVSSGEQALIHVGQKRPNIIKRTTSTTGGTTDVSYEYGNPAWIEIGTKVVVSPVVNTESNITVRIEPELNREIGEIEPQPGLTFPILVSRKVSSEFVIQSGQTVAIGGLTGTEDKEVVKKIPVLGDIPLIGKYLFSHTSTKKEQDETIIFVTVGLAKPEEMNSTTGVPSGGALIYEKYENQKGQIDLRNKRRDALEAKRAKAAEEAATAKKNGAKTEKAEPTA